MVARRSSTEIQRVAAEAHMRTLAPKETPSLASMASRPLPRRESSQAPLSAEKRRLGGLVATGRVSGGAGRRSPRRSTEEPSSKRRWASSALVTVWCRISSSDSSDCSLVSSSAVEEEDDSASASSSASSSAGLLAASRRSFLALLAERERKKPRGGVRVGVSKVGRRGMVSEWMRFLRRLRWTRSGSASTGKALPTCRRACSCLRRYSASILAISARALARSAQTAWTMPECQFSRELGVLRASKASASQATASIERGSSSVGCSADGRRR
mmetsp:Transcript_20677/g.65021  ORF Transcript_20677/g.65021 Transcript_20677/m.65021 type:complete len:272 (-) Transcript_20677:3339-4154(-)